MKTVKYNIGRHSSFTFKKVLFSLMYIAFVGLVSSILFVDIKDQVEYQNSWQAHAAYDFEEIIETDENGEENLVYCISTPEQLAGMFNQSVVSADDYKSNNIISENRVYKLTNNIDLSGKSWSPAELPKNYTFEGNGFVISKLNARSSTPVYILGFLSANRGTVKDLTFKNITVDNGSTGYRSTTYVGCVCGYNFGTIQNVSVVGSSVVYGSSYDNSYRYVGGICGYNSGTIFRCINYATVSYGEYSGGICGYSNGVIKNCFNYGSVSNSYTLGNAYAGGICGGGYTISLCINHGTITSYGTSSYSYAGGIVGNTTQTVDQCENNGSVTAGGGSTTRSYAGGIVGYGRVVTNSFNKANITAYAKETTTNNGVSTENKELSVIHVGRQRIIVSYRDVWMKVFNGVYANSGNLSQYDYSYSKYAYAGGIAGYSGYTITSCYNMGQISGGHTRRQIQKALTNEIWYDEAAGGYSYQDTVFYYADLKVYTYAGINGCRSSSVEKSSSLYTYSYAYSRKMSYFNEFNGSTYNSSTTNGYNSNSGSWCNIAENFYYSYYRYSYNYKSVDAYNGNIRVYAFTYNAKNCGGSHVYSGDGYGYSSDIYAYDFSMAYKDEQCYNSYPSLSILNSEHFTTTSGYNNGYPYLGNLYW